MPGFKGNEERLIREKWPKGWLWQGSPFVAAVTPLPISQPLIVAPQSLQSRRPTVVILSTQITVPPPPPDPPSKQLFVLPTRLRPTPPAVLGRAMLSVAILQTPATKHLIVSIRPPGRRPTTPSLLSAGIGIVPEPSELVSSPLITQREPAPPPSPPTLHGGLRIVAAVPPHPQLIVPPPTTIIKAPPLLIGHAHEEIIVPRGHLVVPAQKLPQTLPSTTRQFPSAYFDVLSTYWIPRGWIPDGWILLPAAEAPPLSSAGTQLIAPAPQKKKQTPTALARSFTPTVQIALSHPSRPLIVPASEQPKTAQPNTLAWHTPPLEVTSLPLSRQLIVPSSATQEQKPSTVRSIITPVVAVPQAQPLIVPGQPHPPVSQAELGWFTPAAIVPPSGQFLIVLPELPPDQNRLRSAISRTIRFPVPTIPPINAQLIVRNQPIPVNQPTFVIIGGGLLAAPPVPQVLSLGLLAYESDAEFVFSKLSDSTL